MTNPKDYSSKVWVAALWLILLLGVVSFIPPLEVCGLQLRRANILSEVLTFPVAAQDEVLLQEATLEHIEVDWESISAQVAESQQPQEEEQEQRLFEWVVSAADSLPERGSLPALHPIEAKVPIEDFDTTALSPMRALYAKLARHKRVRIAFLGDSFVEGDILTADLREALQDSFGGSGAGFAPIASPLTGFRRTIKTQSKGWTPYNVMQHSTSPSQVRDAFMISGWVCRPERGASTRWEMSDARRNLAPCRGANIWLRSEAQSCVELILNDTLSRRFTLEGDPSLRQISLSCPELYALELRVIDGASSLVGYGAQFHGEEGVTLDNFSVRSNNGRALFSTSASLNAQLHQLAPYDLVVLQYGLNIMQQGVLGYSRYSAQLEQMVAYVRECFPGAAVLLLGVSERWVKGEEGFAPMDAIPAMLEAQRRAARESGAAFWDTCAAMQAQGGMQHFVAQGWAGKDYTHINYGGGRRIAQELFDALYDAAAKVGQEELQREIQRNEIDPIKPEESLDSLLWQSLIPTIQ